MLNLSTTKKSSVKGHPSGPLLPKLKSTICQRMSDTARYKELSYKPVCSSNSLLSFKLNNNGNKCGDKSELDTPDPGARGKHNAKIVSKVNKKRGKRKEEKRKSNNKDCLRPDKYFDSVVKVNKKRVANNDIASHKFNNVSSGISDLSSPNNKKPRKLKQKHRLHKPVDSSTQVTAICKLQRLHDINKRSSEFTNNTNNTVLQKRSVQKLKSRRKKQYEKQCRSSRKFTTNFTYNKARPSKVKTPNKTPQKHFLNDKMEQESQSVMTENNNDGATVDIDVTGCSTPSATYSSSVSYKSIQKVSDKMTAKNENDTNHHNFNYDVKYTDSDKECFAKFVNKKKLQKKDTKSKSLIEDTETLSKNSNVNKYKSPKKLFSEYEMQEKISLQKKKDSLTDQLNVSNRSPKIYSKNQESIVPNQHSSLASPNLQSQENSLRDTSDRIHQSVWADSQTHADNNYNINNNKKLYLQSVVNISELQNKIRKKRGKYATSLIDSKSSKKVSNTDSHHATRNITNNDDDDSGKAGYMNMPKMTFSAITSHILFNRKFQSFINYGSKMPLNNILNNVKSNYRQYSLLGQSSLSSDEIEWLIANMKIFTYRQNMNIPYKKMILSDDQGWGCMLRSGQMLLYNLILKECLSAFDGSWKNYETSDLVYNKKGIFRTLFDVFDDHNNLNLFSFRNIFQTGVSVFQKRQREFWTSNTFFRVIKTIVSEIKYTDKYQALFTSSQFVDKNQTPILKDFQRRVFQTVQKMKIILISDGIVDETKIKKYFQKKADKKSTITNTANDDHHIKPESAYNSKKMLILPVILQLGHKNCEQRYKDFIIQFMQLPSFAGMLGGKDKKAYYFFGCSEKKTSNNGSICIDNKLLYLDPHVTQEMYKRYKNYIQEDTFQIESIYRTDFSKLNPSVCLVFKFSDLEEFEDFKQRTNEIQIGLNEEKSKCYENLLFFKTSNKNRKKHKIEVVAESSNNQKSHFVSFEDGNQLSKQKCYTKSSKYMSDQSEEDIEIIDINQLEDLSKRNIEQMNYEILTSGKLNFENEFGFNSRQTDSENKIQKQMESSSKAFNIVGEETTQKFNTDNHIEEMCKETESRVRRGVVKLEFCLNNVKNKVGRKVSLTEKTLRRDSFYILNHPSNEKRNSNLSSVFKNPIEIMESGQIGEINNDGTDEQKKDFMLEPTQILKMVESPVACLKSIKRKFIHKFTQDLSVHSKKGTLTFGSPNQGSINQNICKHKSNKESPNKTNCQIKTCKQIFLRDTRNSASKGNDSELSNSETPIGRKRLSSFQFDCIDIDEKKRFEVNTERKDSYSHSSQTESFRKNSDNSNPRKMSGKSYESEFQMLEEEGSLKLNTKCSFNKGSHIKNTGFIGPSEDIQKSMNRNFSKTNLKNVKKEDEQKLCKGLKKYKQTTSINSLPINNLKILTYVTFHNKRIKKKKGSNKIECSKTPNCNSAKRMKKRYSELDIRKNSEHLSSSKNPKSKGITQVNSHDNIKDLRNSYNSSEINFASGTTSMQEMKYKTVLKSKKCPQQNESFFDENDESFCLLNTQNKRVDSHEDILNIRKKSSGCCNELGFLLDIVDSDYEFEVDVSATSHGRSKTDNRGNDTGIS